MDSAIHVLPGPTLLAEFGNSLLGMVVQTTTFTLFYGVFVLLFVQVTATFLRKRRLGKKPHLWMFLASALSFLLATVQAGAYIAIPSMFLHSALVGNQSLPLTEKILQANDLLLKPNVVVAWMASFEHIISDSIVIWRAFVVLQQKRWLLIPVLFLLLCSAASALVNLIFLHISRDMNKLSVTTSYMVSIGLSVGTNIVATLLIGYMYWIHRKAMALGFSRRSRPTQSERTLALLVESGIIFCIPQIVYFLMLGFPGMCAPGTAEHYVHNIFNAGYFVFAAMYPTLVTVLVNSRSAADQLYVFGASLPPISQYVEPSDTRSLQHMEPSGNAVENSEVLEKKGTSMEVGELVES